MSHHPMTTTQPARPRRSLRLLPLAALACLAGQAPREARAEGGPGEAPAVIGDAFAYVAYSGSSVLSSFSTSQRPVTVTDRGAGVYRVLFPVSVVPRNQRNYAAPPAPNDGNVQVRAFGNTLGTCVADSWGPAPEGGTELVVRCFGVPTPPPNTMATAVPQSMGFAAVFMAQGNQPGPTVPYAWIMAPQSSSPSNAAPIHWRSRSWVAPWGVERDPLGNVLVGPANPAPNTFMIATPTGPLPRTCAWRWVYPDRVRRSSVGCAPLVGGGSAVTPFSVAVLDGNTLAPMRRDGGYAAFDASGQPDPGLAADGAPPPNWSSNGQRVTARVVAAGQYQVRFPRLGAPGGVALAQWCQATGTGVDGLDQVVDVTCPGRVSRAFSVVFVR